MLELPLDPRNLARASKLLDEVTKKHTRWATHESGTLSEKRAWTSYQKSRAKFLKFLAKHLD